MGLDEELYLRKLELDNERFRGTHKRPQTKRTALKVRSRTRKRANGLCWVLLLAVACGLGWGVYEAGNRFSATAPAPKKAKAVIAAPGHALPPKKPVVRSARPLARRTSPVESPTFSKPSPVAPVRPIPSKPSAPYGAELEAQVRAGTLSRLEAEQLAGGYKRNQQSVRPRPVRTFAPQAAPSIARYPTQPDVPAGGMVAPDCPSLIVSDIRYHLTFDPIVDGPRFGSGTTSESIRVSNGQPISEWNVSGSRPMGLAGALHRAVALAVQGGSLSQPSCGAPTGTLSVSATNRYSMGQWAVEVVLASSSLR